MKKIFITNDDGIKSPGLLAAVEAVIDLGEIIVVAPSSQQTAMSRSLRSVAGEYLRELDFKVNGNCIKAFHCDASPAMIVQHAFNVMFNQKKPDLIISGINYGANLGYDAMLSGTVGAAYQGAAAGIPAIAVSLQTEIHHHWNYGEVNWEGSKHFLKLFSEKILSGGMPLNTDVIKIDVPAEATHKSDWRVTKVAKQHYYIAEFENPSINSKVDEIKVRVNELNPGLPEDTDIYALEVDKVVSVTPMTMDMSALIDSQNIF